ncbi:hypothetical protein [Gynuella sunshinyii]|nr:hypothetical protein [Gynuella sunshinyii]
MENFWEVLSIVSSIVSVIIGGFAIWLSVTFYKWSNKVSEDTKEAAKGISASVDRLEVLFDRLYSDTFGMMKDTVSDMRKHIWSDSSEVTDALQEKSNQKIEEVKKEMKAELESVLSRVGQTEGKVDHISVDLDSVIQRAIDETRKIDSDTLISDVDVNVLNDVLDVIRQKEAVSVRSVIYSPRLRRTYTKSAILEAIQTNIDAEIVVANGPIRKLETQLIYQPKFDS